MFRYTADFPLNNVPTSKIMRNLGVKKFKYVGLGSNKNYLSLEHGYELSFDHDMGFVKFNNELNNKIGAILDEITDIVGAKRGEYTIIDDATGDEVCLDALNDVYPASEYKQYRYSVRLFPANAKSIQQSIMIALPNIVLNDNEESYKFEKYDLEIDGNESVCFYFTSDKLDINYVNSIIYPVMKALGYQKFDYAVDDYVTGEEIPCEGDFIDEDPEHSFSESESEAEQEDNKSSCSSYEFGQPTQDEAEEWLAEMEDENSAEEYNRVRKEQKEYIYNVKYNIRETEYANMCESEAEDEDSASLDDEWLPPAEQRKKDIKIANAKKRDLANANKKALKEQVAIELAKIKAEKKALKEAKKANMTEEEKVAYAVKVEAIIADRRAKKALRLQAEKEEEKRQEEELYKAAYNEMYALDEVEARREARKEAKEKQERIQKKLQRLHRQLN